MDLFRDLPPGWIYVKAGLFLVLVAVSGAILILQSPSLRTAFLLAVCIWSACRLYYFLFYVLERYIDPELKSSGLFDLFRQLAQRSRGKK